MAAESANRSDQFFRPGPKTGSPKQQQGIPDRIRQYGDTGNTSWIDQLQRGKHIPLDAAVQLFQRQDNRLLNLFLRQHGKIHPQFASARSSPPGTRGEVSGEEQRVKKLGEPPVPYTPEFRDRELRAEANLMIFVPSVQSHLTAPLMKPFACFSISSMPLSNSSSE